MIRVSLNGDNTELADAMTVEAALKLWGYTCEEIAVAVNNEFVPRSRYGAAVLCDSDTIDVVAPVQGG